MAGAYTDTSAPAREIVTIRTFQAPRELVFEAWTSPERIGQWWGPNGFTTTTHEMEFRVGGAWRYIMHGPDGTDYPNKVVYTNIEPPERIEYDHGYDNDGPPLFQATVTFAERDGVTELTLRTLFPSDEACEQVKQYGAVEGARQTLDRLAGYLGETAT